MSLFENRPLALVGAAVLSTALIWATTGLAADGDTMSHNQSMTQDHGMPSDDTPPTGANSRNAQNTYQQNLTKRTKAGNPVADGSRTVHDDTPPTGAISENADNTYQTNLSKRTKAGNGIPGDNRVSNDDTPPTGANSANAANTYQNNLNGKATSGMEGS